MLRRNREIVIFNLSAIDLFCSGMGAVMVLMVLLMPYYGKKAPTPPKSPDPVVVVTPPKSQPQPGVTLRSIEVVFVMDATMSMNEELSSVRGSMTSIVQVLRRLGDHVRVGFVAYIDHDVPWVIPLCDVGRSPAGDANLRQLLSKMAEVRLVGNEDWPEDVCAGLAKATSSAWSPPSEDHRQLILLIGDARTHPIDRMKSLQIVTSWAAAGAQSRGVHTVFTPPVELASQAGFEEEIGSSEVYFREVAKAGNGRFHAGQGDLLGDILDILIVR